VTSARTTNANAIAQRSSAAERALKQRRASALTRAALRE